MCLRQYQRVSVRLAKLFKSRIAIHKQFPIFQVPFAERARLRPFPDLTGQQSLWQRLIARLLGSPPVRWRLWDSSAFLSIDILFDEMSNAKPTTSLEMPWLGWLEVNYCLTPENIPAPAFSSLYRRFLINRTKISSLGVKLWSFLRWMSWQFSRLNNTSPASLKQTLCHSDSTSHDTQSFKLWHKALQTSDRRKMQHPRFPGSPYDAATRSSMTSSAGSWSSVSTLKDFFANKYSLMYFLVVAVRPFGFWLSVLATCQGMQNTN